ncbi:hypothetical protein ABZ016_13765 [Streptomyces sp. NPDC006372]|uniref:hypothetical protein n=1 Tax=Streptomyces sp. NPDC006372 TaxID=3155599 RepID=UPI0033A09385
MTAPSHPIQDVAKEAPQSGGGCPVQGNVDQLLVSDPYQAYALLWSQGDGTVWHEPTRSWYVTDPARIREMLTDRRFVARGASPLEPALDDAPGAQAVLELEAFLGCWPVFSDAPIQRAASQALRKHFSRAQAERLRPTLREAFAEIVHRADSRKLVSTFAQPVSQVTLSLLLRLPVEEVNQLRAMTAPTITYLAHDGQDVALARAALTRIMDLEAWLSARGRTQDDWLLNELNAAGVELTSRELAAVYMQIVTGALDPTSNALIGALKCIKHAPEARGLMAAGDFAGLVNRCLSRDTGFHFAPRRSQCPITFHGHHVGPGERVVGVVAWAAAVDAETDGHAAESGALPPHATSMAFGYGRHFCLGASIAQVTLEEALRSLLSHRDPAELEIDGVERIPALGASVYRDGSSRPKIPDME